MTVMQFYKTFLLVVLIIPVVACETVSSSFNNRSEQGSASDASA